MQKYYLTTAINYTNGPPHMGHAYEAIIADVIARFQRFLGKKTFFLTGTDEHGQKIADTANGLGITPIELCDRNVQLFRDLNKSLLLSNDNFVRTSSPNHKKIAQEIWNIAEENGDIYLGQYSGWYNIREERFVTEVEAQANNFLDSVSGKPLVKYEEPSYFFRLSKYGPNILDHIRNNPQFIQPETNQNEILKRLIDNPLQDLSISRTTFSWGVPVPGKTKNEEDLKQEAKDLLSHVMYVWFDALTNYLSGVDWPKQQGKEFWPADLHLIGKDILWFHAVIWTGILLSCGLELPKKIFAHGFIVAADGTKMSKSLGNTVDPNIIIKKYGPEPLRWYLLRESPLGQTLSFSEQSLISRFNTELCDEFLNLANRSLSICFKYCDGFIHPIGEDDQFIIYPFDLETLKEKVIKCLESLDLHKLAEIILEASRQTNKWLNEQAPWHSKDLTFQKGVSNILINTVFILTHFYEPFFPISAKKIFDRFNHNFSSENNGNSSEIFKKLNWNILSNEKEVTRIIKVKEPLFHKIAVCQKCNTAIQNDDIKWLIKGKRRVSYHKGCYGDPLTPDVCTEVSHGAK